jgi:hypothetical protein
MVLNGVSTEPGCTGAAISTRRHAGLTFTSCARLGNRPSSCSGTEMTLRASV